MVMAGWSIDVEQCEFMNYGSQTTINTNFILFNNENYKKHIVCKISFCSINSLTSPTNTIIDMHVVVHDFLVIF